MLSRWSQSKLELLYYDILILAKLTTIEPNFFYLLEELFSIFKLIDYLFKDSA